MEIIFHLLQQPGDDQTYVRSFIWVSRLGSRCSSPWTIFWCFSQELSMEQMQVEQLGQEAAPPGYASVPGIGFTCYVTILAYSRIVQTSNTVLSVNILYNPLYFVVFMQKTSHPNWIFLISCLFLFHLICMRILQQAVEGWNLQKLILAQTFSAIHLQFFLHKPSLP